MKAALRATAILSGSSFLRIFIGAVSAKGWALIVGPVGVGTLGLLQSLVGTVGLVAGLGVSTVLVRLISEARSRGDEADAEALWKGGGVLTWAAGGVALLICWAASEPVAKWTLGDPSHATTVMLTGVAILFTINYDLELGLLNAFSKIGAIAKSSLVYSVAVVPINLGIVAAFGVEGIPWAVVASSIVTWGVVKMTVRRSVGREPSFPPMARLRNAVSALLRFGLPYMASTSMGLGVQRALPVLLVSFITVTELGVYRAAAIIVAQLGFLTTALGQDYYPRVSAAAPADLAGVVRDQVKIVTFIGAPTVVLAQTFSGLAIRVLFTSEFAQASAVLVLQLPGFMLLAWSLPFSYSILGRQSRRSYLLLEAAMGAVTLLAFWALVRPFGLIGAGIAYTVSYGVYLCLAITIHDAPLSKIVDREVVVYVLLFAGATTAILLSPSAGWMSPVGLGASVILIMVSLVGIRKQFA